MAVDYANFSEAWPDFRNSYGTVQPWMGFCYTAIGNINSMWGTGDEAGAIAQVVTALSMLYDTIRVLFDTDKSPWYNSHFMACMYLGWLEGGEPPPYTLTLDAMINTMLLATSDEITAFIGIVDAYRQSIWDKPFNREYYAALARGFQEWG